MLVVSFAAIKLQPSEAIGAYKGAQKLQLESYIPQTFNDWRVLEMNALLVNPRLEKALNEIYAETLSRTYVDSNNNRVMLSIAYGENQSDSVALHAPEGCYGGQGFKIESLSKDMYVADFGRFPVMRMLAQKTDRIEPVTYWMRIGEKVVYPGKDTKIQKIKYGLNGKIPDGLLFRVSTILNDTSESSIKSAFETQDRFVNDLVLSVSTDRRAYIIGSLQYEPSKNR